jgi:hypothetical protein
MISRLKYKAKRAIFPAVPRIPWFSNRILRLLLQSLLNQIVDEATEKFPHFLLEGMDWYLCFSPRYRENIEDLDGKYVFRLLKSPPNSRETLWAKIGKRIATAVSKLLRKSDGDKQFIIFSASFRRGEMYVQAKELEEWDLRITFQDAAGMRAFLFSKDEDMLNAILEDKVRTEGNWNYLYKFGYMARYLCNRVNTLFLKGYEP